MARGMKGLTALFAILTILCIGLQVWLTAGPWLTLAITFGTCTYHFLMRLLVGRGIDAVFHNRMDASRPWFQPRPFEQQLYKKLKLYRWKKHLPTYDPTAFSLEEHTPQEIVGAMCQAEVVHEVIMVGSFLPLLAAIPFGDFWVFFATSLAAALFDLVFVMLQRYNRPRIIKILNRGKKCH